MELWRSVLAAAFLWIVAKLLGWLLSRLKLPSLFGELLAGAIVGPYALHWVDPSSLLTALTTLGSIVLLFSIGLETRLERIWRVGRSAAVTATLGVLLPFGFIALAALLFKYSITSSLFLATAGAATSVGITARILQDGKALGTTAGRIILGAAVLDDVLDIVALAIIGSYAKTGVLPGLDLLLVVAQIVIFITAVVLFLPQIMRHAERALPGRRSTVPLAVLSMLSLSALSVYVGLAAIIGAFLSGITFAESRSREQIARFLKPWASLLIPFFFAGIGMKFDLHIFGAWHMLFAALVITAVAVLGKLLAGYLATYEHGVTTALAVGMGMVPRGEVGLIVASSGYVLGVISQEVVAIVVFVTLVSTLFAPLTLTILRSGRHI